MGVAWAQAQREIPLLGTTHADLCAFPIPLTRALTDDEIASDYEGATGTTLVELIAERGPLELPARSSAGTRRSAGRRPPPKRSTSPSRSSRWRGWRC